MALDIVLKGCFVGPPPGAWGAPDPPSSDMEPLVETVGTRHLDVRACWMGLKTTPGDSSW